MLTDCPGSSGRSLGRNRCNTAGGEHSSVFEEEERCHMYMAHTGELRGTYHGSTLNKGSLALRLPTAQGGREPAN